MKDSEAIESYLCDHLLGSSVLFLLGRFLKIEISDRVAFSALREGFREEFRGSSAQIYSWKMRASYAEAVAAL